MKLQQFRDQDFDDIRPYRDKELREKLQEYIRDNWTLTTLRRFFWPGCPDILSPLIEKVISIVLILKTYRIHTADEFHVRFMKKLVLEWIKDRTMTSLSYTGVQHISSSYPSLFITNHRDITLDVAFLCYILMENHFRTPEIAFGDNLLMNKIVSDLIRINKGFIVKRNLPMREQIQQSLHLSQYIWHTFNNNSSIWLAQRGGRAKDGDDRTNPSIIKMLYLSQRKHGMDFSSFINALNIVPVSISYEYDPCDVMKAKEVHSVRTQGFYEKRNREDLISILKGINEQKGRVHFYFCPPLKGTWETAREVADAIDEKIITSYKLWPTNYISYDLLSASEKYCEYYSSEEKELFLDRYREVPEELRKVVLEIYACPVINYERFVGQQ